MNWPNTIVEENIVRQDSREGVRDKRTLYWIPKKAGEIWPMVPLGSLRKNSHYWTGDGEWIKIPQGCLIIEKNRY